MNKLYIVLDSELAMNEMGFNEGGCGVFSTYEDALDSAKARHSYPYGTSDEEVSPYYDYQIMIVAKIGHSINQREIYFNPPKQGQKLTGQVTHCGDTIL